MQADHQPLSHKRKVKGYGALPHSEGEHEADDHYVEIHEAKLSPSVGGATRIQSPSVFGIFINLIVYVVGLIILPLMSSFFTVNPKQHSLVIFWGSLTRVVKEPGLYWYPPVGRVIRVIPTNVQSLEIKKSTVVDLKGNPIVVAGVVTFQVVDSVKAAFDVGCYASYLQMQSLAVLKRVCSLYPYECRSSGKSLQSESAEVSALLVRMLQEKADVAGCRVMSYELTDLQYAPEIAPGMLVRQQAEAMVEARHTIVDGAVQIVTAAVGKLAESGVHLNDSQQARLVSNLLAVICGDSHVTPTFNVSSEGNDSDEAEEHFRNKMAATLAQIAVNTTPRQ